MGALLVAGTVACGSDDEPGGDARRAVRNARGTPPLAVASAHESLARAAGAAGYSAMPDDTASPRTVARGGAISGVVRASADADTGLAITPTHDAPTCRDARIASDVSLDGTLANAVVWLVGVSSGPPDLTPRRVDITLTGCALEPRVQRAPAGATLLVRSTDPIDSRLRFTEAYAPATATPRALVPLGDAGAVVPTQGVLAAPGLVEVRDDRHPWVRGWIAVAPHPFVAVTTTDGRFNLSNVPPGEYTLVVWHERAGRLVLPVTVEAGIESRLRLTVADDN